MTEQNKPCFEALEDRVLLSATAFDSEMAVHSSVQDEQNEQKTVQVTELLVIDEAVDNYQEVLENLDKPNLEIQFIDSTQNGLEQLSSILSQYENLDALHIISHGSEGQISLGNALVNSESLSQNEELISQWNASFSENADILIYGCDLAGNANGEDFVNTLASLTKTDVAASDDITGIGGDAELEYETGTIESNELFSQADYESAGLRLADSPVAGAVRDITYFVSPSDPVDLVNQPGLTSSVSTGESSGIGNTNLSFVSSDGTVTFELAFKPDSANADGVLFETGGGTKGLIISLDNGEISVLAGRANNSQHIFLTTTSLSLDTDKFNQVAVTYDQASGTLSLYVNGNLEAQDTGNIDWRGTSKAFIAKVDGGIASRGAFLPTNQFFGEIASFRAYGSALDLGEIQQNYNSFNGGAVVPGAIEDLSYFATATSPVNIADQSALTKAIVFGDSQGFHADTLRNISSDETVTFELAFRPNDANQSGVVFETGGSVQGLVITMNNGQISVLAGRSDTADHILLTTSGLNLSTEEFTQVIVTYDSSNTLKLYVNGELEESATLNIRWRGSNGASLGTLDGGINPRKALIPINDFIGDIALFRAYNDALDQAGVTQNYNAIINNAPVLEISNENKFSLARYNYTPNQLPETPEFPGDPVYVALVDEISDPRADGGSDFGLHFSGYIEITTAGDYTFSTRSDDGSDLYINGVKVVDNDGLHGARTQTGTVNLSAGLHKIDVLFFENGGGDSLSVSYSGADTGNVGSAILPATSTPAFDIAYTLEGTEPAGANPSLSSDASNNLLSKVTDDGSVLKVGTVQGNGASAIVANNSLEAGTSQVISVNLLDEARNSYTVSVTVNPDGSYTVSDLAQLKDGLTARGFFSFDVVDEAGLSTGTFKVALAITGSNVVPTINTLPSGESTEDVLSGTLTGLSFTDADGDRLTYLAQNNANIDNADITSPAGVTLSNVRVTLNSAGTFTVTGDGFDQLQAGESAIINFDVRLTDGSFISTPQTIQIEIAGVNDAPELSSVTDPSFTAKRYTYTPDQLPETPEFPGTPISTTEVSEIADPSSNDGSDFAIHFEGYIEILVAGDYTFSTRSDDGSDLYIGGDKIVDNDGLHGLRTRTGTVNLDAGLHKIDVLFFENGGGDQLITAYSGPDTGNSFQAIPAARAEIATALIVNVSETPGSNSIIEFDAANGLLQDALDADGNKQSVGTVQGKDGEVIVTNNSNEAFVQQIIAVELKDQNNITYIVDVTIKSDGSYSISDIDQLPEGATAEGSFTFSIVDEQGAESETYQVDLVITGENDDAILSSADIELTEGESPVSTSGNLTISDVDNADEFVSFNSVGTLGELDLLSDGSYTFVANSAFRDLLAGESLTETFNVLSVDGTTTSIKITINGVNDAPSLSGASVSALGVNETESLGTGSSLSVNEANGLLNGVEDPDGDSHSVGTVQGNAGIIRVTNDSTEASTPESFQVTLTDLDSQSYTVDVTVNSDGSYSVDNLDQIPAGAIAEGQFSFTIVDAEGTESEVYTVNIRVTGTNDSALLTSASDDLTESDVPVSSTGQLLSSDLDNPDDLFQATTLNGTLGDLVLQANGTYTFTANSVFRILADNQSLSETFTVQSVDGTETTVTITINGVTSAVDSININSFNSSFVENTANNASSNLGNNSLQTALQELLPPSFFDFVVTESGLDLNVDVSDDFLVVLDRAFANRPIESAEVADSADETDYEGNFYDNPALDPTQIKFIESLLKEVEQFDQQKEQAEDEEQAQVDLPKFDFIQALESDIVIEDPADRLTQYQLDQRKTLSQTLNRNFDTFS